MECRKVKVDKGWNCEMKNNSATPQHCKIYIAIKTHETSL